MSHGRHFAGLDIVRFAAAALVMSYHLLFWSWAPTASTPKTIINNPDIRYPELTDISWFGGIGVQIFFVISGFVIMHSAVRASVGSFVIGRLLRLYPAAIICATISLAAVLVVGAYDDPFKRYLRSVTLWPMGTWIDGVYWTLGIEMAFYAVVALTLALSGRHRLEAVTAVIGAVSTAYLIASELAPHLLPAMDLRVAYLLLLDHGCLFALGTSLWFASNRGWTPLRALTVVVFCAASLLEACRASGSNAELADRTRLIPLFVFLLSAAVIATSSRWSLNARWAGCVRVIGLATYPLYLLHDAVGAAIINVTAGHGLPRFACLAVAVAAVTALSFGVSIYLEPAVKRWLSSALARVARRPQSIHGSKAN